MSVSSTRHRRRQQLISTPFNDLLSLEKKFKKDFIDSLMDI